VLRWQFARLLHRHDDKQQHFPLANTLLNRGSYAMFGSVSQGQRHYQTKSITLNLAIQRLVVGRLVMLRRALVMRRYRVESGG
jgi:hypothetical protein